jgi:phosphomevalonate kinase
MATTRNTLVGSPVVTAPGKLFLIGEYAVLEGGPAVLAAVNRRAVAQFLPGLEPMSAVVAEAVRLARAEIGEASSALPAGSVLASSEDFENGGQKLGLGSSSAVAVAAVGAVFEAVGKPVAANRDRIFALAYAAHRAAQGGSGSGADVATAAYGGLLKVVRQGEGTPSALPLTIPTSLHAVVFWTGKPVATTGMIQAVQQWAQKDRRAYEQLIAELRETAEKFIAGLQAGNATATVAAAGRYGRLLEQLGTAARSPIVTDVFKRAADLAKELGGAAKPSGAGGGDIGIAMFATPETARLFARALPDPLTALDVDLDQRGVYRRSFDDVDPGKSGLFHV